MKNLLFKMQELGEGVGPKPEHIEVAICIKQMMSLALKMMDFVLK